MLLDPPSNILAMRPCFKRLFKGSKAPSAFSAIQSLLFSLLQQASLTHSLKGCSFLSTSIFSTKSSSKRICFLVEPERSNDFFSFFTCMVRTTKL